MVGLGLIGASLAWALRLAGHDVSGWDTSADTRQSIKTMGVAQLAPEGGPHADIVVLATPPRGVLKLLGEVEKGPTLMDVASVKAPILAQAEERGLPFVGGHPLAGAEGRGVEAARPDLFRGQPFFLVPGRYAKAADLERAEAVVGATEAIPTVVRAKDHDTALALTSHLVWAVSRSLGEEGQGLARVFREGPAFRDLTRAGRSPEELWEEILDLNGEAVRGAWEAVRMRVERRIGID